MSAIKKNTTAQDVYDEAKKGKKFAPPTPNYQELDVYTIPKRMVSFIIEAFIRLVIADMRESFPDSPPTLNERYDDILRYETYKRVVDVMDKRKLSITEIKYVRGSKIKVEFSDE